MRPDKVQRLTSEELRTNIYYFGFTDYETKPISYNYPMHMLLPTIDYDFSYPLMIYLWFGSIIPLEEMMHTDVDYINEKGLHIYLYEPMSTYNDSGVPKSRELDSILIYASNNNITNITVHTCEYKCDEIFSYYTKHMKLLNDDLFLRSTIIEHTTMDMNNFTKKFINLNSRFALHRVLTAAYLANRSGYCSWNYKVNIDTLKTIFIDIDNLDKTVEGRLVQGLNYLNQYAPLIVDTPVDRVVNVDNLDNVGNPKYAVRMNSMVEKYYADVFCAIETESIYLSPAANLSEKTLRAIAHRKPFIVVGAMHSLKYLRSMGYKTFSDFWDENYDDEPDYTLRMAKIFKLIDYIDSMSIDQLHDLYDRMQPILEHNNKLLYELQPSKEKFKRLTNINSKLKQVLWVNHNRYYD